MVAASADHWSLISVQVAANVGAQQLLDARSIFKSY